VAVCIANGYASVGRGPFVTRGRYWVPFFGRRTRACLHGNLVEFLETISPLIGEAMHRFHLEKEASTRRRTIPFAGDRDDANSMDNQCSRRSRGRAAFLAGVHRPEPGGHPGWGWIDALHPEDRDHVAGCMVTRRGIAVFVCDRVPGPAGRWRVSRFSPCAAVPVIEPDGAIPEWWEPAPNITEHRRADEELKP